MLHRLRDNPLARPPFADRPLFGFEISAQSLGVVLSVLGIVALLISLLFVVGVSSLCNDLTVCSFPTVDLSGTAVQTVGWAVATGGFARMIALHPDGKLWAVYGLLLALVGALLSLLGDILFVGANPLYYALSWGALTFAAFWMVVCSLFYYLVVTSRFPVREAPVPSALAPDPQPPASVPGQPAPGA
ncbi:MAG: hypothetical protein ACLQGJ_11140 [Candidatus Dormibacteria bacterium]